jgi:hypothetical protein
MKHTKQEKQIINEWVNKFIDYTIHSENHSIHVDMIDFQKQNNLIDDELEVETFEVEQPQTITIKIPKGVDYKIEVI